MESKTKLDSLLELFKFLSSPFSDLTGEEQPARSVNIINSPDAVLQNITEFCLKNVDLLESSKSLIYKDQDVSTRTITEPASSWKLACVILSMLHKLKTTMEEVEAEQTEEEKSIHVLSIQSHIFVQKSVELVIGFGIVPYLLPGLGVPGKLRKMNPSVPHFLLDVQATSPFEQYIRLAHTLEILLCCSKHPTLNAIIAQKYTSDILAGLLQICKSPIVRPKTSQPHQHNSGALSLEQYEKVMEVREIVYALMTDIFLVNVPKPILINSLFLIGAAEKPRWIGTSCNDILCSFMLSRNGLIVLSSTMVDVSGSCDTWKLMRIISSLMRSALLKSGNLVDHAKLSNLGDQCIQMIQQKQEDEKFQSESTSFTSKKCDKKDTLMKLPYGTNVELVKIGLYCGLTLMDIDFQYGKSMFWDKLFCHVVCLNTCQNSQRLDSICMTKNSLLEPSPSEIASNLRNVRMVIMYAEVLLSLLQPMNVSLPFKGLQPVWTLFLQIFVACERYLKKPVQEPSVAAVAEQLHHKLKDVLILLFEIYGSSAGEDLVLPNAGKTGKSNQTGAATTDLNLSSEATSSKRNPREVPKENSTNLCDFIMMLLLNQESHGVPTLNIFDLQCDVEAAPEVKLVLTHQEIISPSSDYSVVYEMYLSEMCACLSNEILKNERLKGIWSILFRELLLWGTMRHTGRKASMQKTFKSDELPTRLDGAGAKVSSPECQKFITFKLLGELGEEEKILEEFGDSESMQETLSFLELLLNKFVDEVSSDVNDAFDASQLIMYALGIIGALIDAAAASAAATSSQCGSSNQSQFPSSEIDKEMNELWDNLEMFVPHLRKLSQATKGNLTRQGVPEMASGLLLSIGSRGLDHKTKMEFPLKTRFQQAKEDAFSPMVHVKGHGILELRRLIEQRDNETLQNEFQVLKIFQENLRNDDSYVYLMSIQGMAALASKFHKTVVPALIQEYDSVCCYDDSGMKENSQSQVDPTCSSSRESVFGKLDKVEQIETRMKVGEILVKVVQKLKELAPSYRAPLTNVFFRMMRDEEPLMRASALSNLGELCHLLKFSLSVVLTEVWFCVDSILSTEKDMHVRRAALHLLVLLLKGVQNDLSARDILTDTGVSQYLRDARRLLTRVEQLEADLVAKTHCQLALQELEMIVKKLLTANTSLSYKIQVLDI